MYEIPLNSDSSHYFFRIDLDSILFEIEIKYNAIADTWFMNLKNVSDPSLIKNGFALLPGGDLLKGHCITGIGGMIVVDITGKGRNPTRDNLGGDVKLFYIEKSEKENGSF